MARHLFCDLTARRPATLRVAALLLAGLAWGSVAAAQPFPPSPEDQRRVVGGWLVEHQPEEDGGRIVRLTRAHGDTLIEHHVAFWHGNAGPFRHAELRRGAQGCPSEDWREDPDQPLWRPLADVGAQARLVRASMAAALAECGAPPEEVEAALRGFEPAFALAEAYAEELRVWTLGVIQSIIDYPNSSTSED